MQKFTCFLDISAFAAIGCNIGANERQCLVLQLNEGYQMVPVGLQPNISQ